MPNWIVLQHVSYEGPGLIVAEAEKRGMCLHTVRIDQGASPPNSDAVEGLIVMGGPMGVYEDDKYPFLEQERKLIATLVQRNTPVLGVCLGSQLLAHALGATVFRGQQPEIGFAPVELTAEGQRDPIFHGVSSPIPVFHWHGDTFELPRGATLLASNTNYPNQAFRVGKRAYGFQFHVEPDSHTWSEWQPHLPVGVFESFEQKHADLLQVGRRVIANFFDLAS